MKFTLSWLKEHLDTTASIDEISRTLTAIGLEVEEINDAAASLGAFTVAEILAARPHPNADKLQVCKVKADDGELQIVCGAPNARAGIKVALAKVGALIPNGEFKIKKSKIRDVESCGMLCSARELNLGEDHAGIMELPDDATIGQPIAEVLGLDDPLIEIAITPNRGDCLGVYGIARDLAAAGLGTLKPLPEIRYQPNRPCPISITLQTPHCPQFIGVQVRGVRNGASPDWLQRKLKAIGLRPISTLVDITNYFTFTYGRPLHVYDADKLTGGIIVRDGVAGEAFEALNDKSYTLLGGECVIADEAGMLGLGGVVGGSSSGVSETTTNVLLECAWFVPEHIAKVGRTLNVLSDARYRFEREVDKGFMQQGAQLATQMILDLCGGEASELQIAGQLDSERRAVKMSDSFIASVGGITLSADEQRQLLHRLGFETADDADGYRVTIPSFRPDVTQPADIAEEVLRIYGYDKIDAVSLPKLATVSPSALTPAQQREVLLRRVMASRGLQECHHWAFMSDEKARHFASVNEALYLRNPISADLNLMRPCLLPHLMDAASRNMARGLEGVALCELGPVFVDASPQGQHSVAAALRAGTHTRKQWNAEAEAASWQHAKADLLALIAAAGVDVEKLQITRDAPDYYHPGRSGAIRLGPKNLLGYFGELHPYTLQAMDVASPMVACECFLDALPLPKRKASAPLVRSEYPAVERDFAFIVDETLQAEDLLRAIKKSDQQLIQQVRLFDVYQGKGVETGKKSLAVSFTLQAPDRTLKEDEIEKVSQSVLSAASQLGAQLRG